MRSAAELEAMLEAIERLIGYSLLGIAIVSALGGLYILFFRVPAKAIVVTNGRASAEKNLRGAVIGNGVYTNDAGLTSCTAEDLLQFSTDAGDELRVSVQRRMSQDPAGLVWYSPANPRRFTTRNPLHCFTLAIASVVTFIWLRW